VVLYDIMQERQQRIGLVYRACMACCQPPKPRTQRLMVQWLDENLLRDGPEVS